jgi:hypothetical protein
MEDLAVSIIVLQLLASVAPPAIGRRVLKSFTLLCKTVSGLALRFGTLLFISASYFLMYASHSAMPTESGVLARFGCRCGIGRRVYLCR